MRQKPTFREMLKDREVRQIIIAVIIFLVITALWIWFLISFLPILCVFAGAPVWLVAALADGGNVK